MPLIRHIPLPRSLQAREQFWKLMTVLIDFKLTKPLVLAALTEMIERDKRERKYRKRIESRARIASGYHGSLNCGRDQKDWLEESFGNLAHSLTFGRPSKFFYIEPILEDEETPIWLRLKTRTFVALMYVRHVMKRKLPIWKTVAIGAVCLATNLLTYFLV